MTFARCSSSRSALRSCLLCVAPRITPGLTRPGRSQPPGGARARQPQTAYSLPPDKLAKAIAISRIRNIMDIVDGLWGIAVLWLLLATAHRRPS